MSNLEMKLTQSVEVGGVPAKSPIPYVIAIDTDGNPISGGGSGGGGGLTDAQLRASPVPVVPSLAQSGNIELAVTTNTPVAFGAQAIKQITIANVSNDLGWVIQGGKRFPLFPMAYFSFFGVTNANQLQVELPADGTVYGHWEA